ncbi:MAG: putative endoribonuclease [Anaeromyxobacteraceae bacterium]|nr:putative endoribonuclease [Anaeromyxobacteraceae bacterium]
MRRTIASPRAPRAIGPYSQAVVTHHADDIQMLHAAGQIPIDPATGELVPGDVVAQAERVMENIAAVLAHAEMDFSDVVKTTVFLVDLADFAAMNEVYGRRFQGEFPARSTIQVAALPKGSRIEVEVHAVKHPRKKAPPKAKARAQKKPGPRKAVAPSRKAKAPARRRRG